MLRLFVSSLAVSVVATIPALAHAGEADAAHAAEISDAGALAASVGDYPWAARAFEKAYALSGQSELLFRLAEVHRQRYLLQQNAGDLGEAVAAYRRYLAAGGAHIDDAQHSLEKLEAELARIPAPSASNEESSLLAVMSPVPRATVRIDGGSPHGLPAFLDVKPGRHVVTVSASGYQDGLAVVESHLGDVAVENVSLDRPPARLDVQKPKESDVYVDGISVGPAPLKRPLDVDPGKHVITISMNGHRAFTQEVAFERGKTETLSPKLSDTPQRTAAWALIGTGGLGLPVAIALGVVAVVKNNAASSIMPARPGEMLGAANQARHDALTSARDNFRAASGAAGGASLGLIVIGGVLYAFNMPPEPATPRHKAAHTEVPLVLPAFAPGFAGGVARFSFE